MAGSFKDELSDGYKEGRTDARNAVETGGISDEYAYRVAKLAIWLGLTCGLVAFVIFWTSLAWGFLISLGVAFLVCWGTVVVIGGSLALITGAMIRNRAKNTK